MRINNKYLRNRAFRNKHWNRIRSKEHHYQNTHGAWFYPTAEQIKWHFDEIIMKVRAMESGTHKQWIFWNASSDFRRVLNKQRKAREHHKLAKIRNGNYEVEFDKYHEDAAWYYF